jgi:DNA-binding XRE family transcriptional regulator
MDPLDLLNRCAASHAALAADLGYSRQIVEMWRRGKKKVSKKAAVKIIALLSPESDSLPCSVCGDRRAHRVNSLGCLRAEKARRG